MTRKRTDPPTPPTRRRATGGGGERTAAPPSAAAAPDDPVEAADLGEDRDEDTVDGLEPPAPAVEAPGPQARPAAAPRAPGPGTGQRPVPPRPRPDAHGAPPDLADIPLEEQTPEMRWPPGSWVRVTDVVRRSTGEPIEAIAVGDIAQVTAALSQTLVLIFPTRDNRREVLHVESIETVEAPPPPGRRRR